MKNSQRLVAALAAFLFAQSVGAQVRNADTMVQKLFASLKAKDQQAFISLYPNSAQFVRFIRDVMQQSLKSDEMKKMMAQDEKTKNMNIDSLIDAQANAFSNPTEFAQMQAAFSGTFQKIIAKGEQKGVDWNKAVITHYTIDSTEGDGSGSAFQPKGMKSMKGVIDFTVGGSPYQLAYDKIAYFPTEGGWFGGEFPQLARKGESMAPDPEMTDSIDSVAVPQPQKKTTNSKGKTTKTTTKSTTTKTPARKPKTKS